MQGAVTATPMTGEVSHAFVQSMADRRGRRSLQGKPLPLHNKKTALGRHFVKKCSPYFLFI